ncbi:MAG TPA: hypothetical protein PKU88_06325 [Bacillota bacterium]|nr:hypothetical protein [Clostridiaceae bacterium]HPX68937.1 hypothetical protein [Bacillota bacterium]HQA66555.1 hypothetical protein [Bacillota bacterium]HQO42464.1 hypothetical protein [Bacillota bacterium]HQQ43486.1 hypothetical protein [Bacillota bacterium]
MNNIYKVIKYQIHDFWKAVLIFYLIIILIASAITVTVSVNGENISFGGLEMATVIFLFVAGLNCFKSNFKFMLANNVSRKGFYIGNTIALVAVSAFMALVDAVLNVILNNVLVSNIPYESVVMQLYGNNSFFAGFLWRFGLNTWAVCFGWFVTMLYYRCNTIMKIVVSFLPVLAFIIYQHVDRILGGLADRAVIDFLTRAMGFAYNNNVYIGALSLITGSAVIALICLLPLRNAVAKG